LDFSILGLEGFSTKEKGQLKQKVAKKVPAQPQGSGAKTGTGCKRIASKGINERGGSLPTTPCSGEIIQRRGGMGLVAIQKLEASPEEAKLFALHNQD